MKPHQVIALIVRLFSIYLLLTAAKDFFQFSLYDAPVGSDPFSVSVYVGTILCFGVSIFLWNFPLAVSRFIYPYAAEEGFTNWRKSEFFVVAFITIGIYFLFGALVDLFYYGISLALVTGEAGVPEPLEAGFVASIASSVFQLVLAVVLIFGASGLKNVLLKIRYGDIKEHSS